MFKVGKIKMGTVWISISMTMLPLGMVIFIFGVEKDDNFSLWIGAFMILCALLMSISSLYIVRREYKESSKKQERLLSLVELIARKLDADVDSIED